MGHSILKINGESLGQPPLFAAGLRPYIRANHPISPPSVHIYACMLSVRTRACPVLRWHLAEGNLCIPGLHLSRVPCCQRLFEQQPNALDAGPEWWLFDCLCTLA